MIKEKKQIPSSCLGGEGKGGTLPRRGEKDFLMFSITMSVVI
jgi:hypothetical protein